MTGRRAPPRAAPPPPRGRGGVGGGPGGPPPPTALAGQLPVTRQAVVKHLAILEESELVTRRRDGREVVFTVRPERLVATASWMTSLAASWAERLQVLKQVAEAGPVPRAADPGPSAGRPG